MIIQADGQGRTKEPSVLIGLTDQWVHAATMSKVLEVVTTANIKKEVHIQDHGGDYIRSRRMIAEHFMRTDHDRLVLIEKGVAPSMSIIDLLGFDRDVIGCPVPRIASGPQGPALQWNAFDDMGDIIQHQPVDGVTMERVDGVGHGCLVLSKQAVRRREALLAADMVEFSRSIRKDGLTFWCHYGSPCNAVKETDGLAVNAILTSFAKQPGLKIATS